MVSLLAPYFFKEKTEEVEDQVPRATTSDNECEDEPFTVFDDFNALESGEAREFIPYSFLLPSEDWSLCKVYRTNHVEFTMVLEPSNGTISSEKFMLSAKRVGDDFYISQYECFAKEGHPTMVPKSRYCAILKAVCTGKSSGGKSKMKKWELLPASLGGVNNAPPLATISHSVFVQPGSGADIRMLDVCLPDYGTSINDEDKVVSSSKFRDFGFDEVNTNGCDRNMYAWDLNRDTKQPKFRNYFQAGDFDDLAAMKPTRLSSSISTSSLASTSTSTSTSPTSSPTASGRSKSSPSPRTSTSEQLSSRLPIQIASMIPMWDPSSNSLLIKFMRNRVKCSSSKNFQFYDSRQVRSGGGNKWRSGSEVHISNAVVQFGKLEADVYSLDFRNPVGPLHAFAMVLSAFPQVQQNQQASQ